MNEIDRNIIKTQKFVQASENESEPQSIVSKKGNETGNIVRRQNIENGDGNGNELLSIVNGNGNIIGHQSIEHEGGNDNELQSIVNGNENGTRNVELSQSIVNGNGNGTGDVELPQSIVNGNEKNIGHKSKQKTKKSPRRL